MYKLGQIFQQFGLPCVVTGLITDNDPYLYYNKRVQYKNVITGEITSFADTRTNNPYCDISAVLNGKLKSRYSAAI